MSRHVSVVRDADGLAESVAILTTTLDALPSDSSRRDDWIVANMALAGLAIACAALNRDESRGAHFRSDFPETDPALDGIHFALIARPEVDDLWMAGSLDAARRQATV
jgi:L-aspartate oxidase